MSKENALIQLPISARYLFLFCRRLIAGGVALSSLFFIQTNASHAQAVAPIVGEWQKNSNVTPQHKGIPSWVVAYNLPYGKPTLFPSARPFPEKYAELLKSRVTVSQLENDWRVDKKHRGHLTWVFGGASFLEFKGTVFLSASWYTEELVNLSTDRFDPGAYVANQFLTIRNKKFVYESLEGGFYTEGQENLFQSLIDKANREKFDAQDTPAYRTPDWIVVNSGGKPSVFNASREDHKIGRPELKVFDTQGRITGHILGERRSSLQIAYVPDAKRVVVVARGAHKALIPEERDIFTVTEGDFKNIRKYEQGRAAVAALNCEQQVEDKQWRCGGEKVFDSLIFRSYVINSDSSLGLMRGPEYVTILGSLFSVAFSGSKYGKKFILSRDMESKNPPDIYEILRAFSALEALESPEAISGIYKSDAQVQKLQLEPRPIALLLAASGRRALLPVFDKP
jgi:hypothetical protein